MSPEPATKQCLCKPRSKDCTHPNGSHQTLPIILYVNESDSLCSHDNGSRLEPQSRLRRRPSCTFDGLLDSLYRKMILNILARQPNPEEPNDWEWGARILCVPAAALAGGRKHGSNCTRCSMKSRTADLFIEHTV